MMDVTPARWQRIEELYHGARARPPAERAAFLADACVEDESLRREVEALLAQPVSEAGVLDGAALAVAAHTVSESRDSTLAGRRLGVYQV
ncbi:MAG: hypothetical protein ACRDFA_06495, partial [bacterium]